MPRPSCAEQTEQLNDRRGAPPCRSLEKALAGIGVLNGGERNDGDREPTTASRIALPAVRSFISDIKNRCAKYARISGTSRLVAADSIFSAATEAFLPIAGAVKLA